MASCSEEKKLVLLISSDKELFEISEAAAQQSETIVRILKDGVAGKGIPLRKVNSKTLRKVIEFCNRHAAADDAEYPNNETTEQFEDKLLQPLQIYELVNLIVAADYLDIKFLLAVAIYFFNCAIENKTPEEIHEHLNDNFEEHHKSVTGIIKWFSSTFDIATGEVLATATAEDNKRLLLVTSDNEMFGYPEAAAMLTECIKKVIEDGNMEGIPVPDVDPKALAKVFDFIDDPAGRSQEMNVLIDAVLCIYIWNNSERGINKLRRILTRAITRGIKNKSEEEVRQYFNVGD